ncbi:hypothetical protein [Paenibacillus hubeiensis]|uniref:hypothetical protein n=1 Tax=Paenibacillus hubeiensis TaxID=3077330 RepID=UPI0031B9FA21
MMKSYMRIPKRHQIVNTTAIISAANFAKLVGCKRAFNGVMFPMGCGLELNFHVLFAPFGLKKCGGSSWDANFLALLTAAWDWVPEGRIFAF